MLVQDNCLLLMPYIDWIPIINNNESTEVLDPHGYALFIIHCWLYCGLYRAHQKQFFYLFLFYKKCFLFPYVHVPWYMATQAWADKVPPFGPQLLLQTSAKRLCYLCQSQLKLVKREGTARLGLVQNTIRGSKNSITWHEQTRLYLLTILRVCILLLLLLWLMKVLGLRTPVAV